MAEFTQQLYDYHFTLVFSNGGYLPEGSMSLSAVTVTKATLRITTENFGPTDRFVIEYYEAGTWKTLAEVSGSKTQSFDVTSKIAPLDQFRYRAAGWFNWCAYWTCGHAYAEITIEYTAGEITPPSPLTGEAYLGQTEMGSIGYIISVFMQMFMISMIMSVIAAMLGGFGGE